jgi:energy-coupling factor transporter ATP-binding protein EcfA2
MPALPDSQWAERLSRPASLLRQRLWWPARRRQVRRWGSRLAVAAPLVAAVILLLGPVSKTCSASKNSFTCGIGENVVSAVVVGALGLLAWYLWTRARLVRAYLRMVRTDPAGLLGPASVTVGQEAILARLESCEEIAEEVRSSGAATQVIVGSAGSGKTTLLLALALYLAERGAVPVVVPLRGAGLEIDIVELARERLLAKVDDRIGSDGHADRLWRQLRKAGRLVVLADGLDEATAQPSVLAAPGLARGVLRAGSDRGIPVVVTSRPEALPDAERAGAFSVPPVPVGEVLSRLEETVGAAVGRDALRHLAETADMATTPFYLQIATERARLDATDRDRARLDLLDGYLEWIKLGGRAGPQADGDTTRGKMVEELTKLAYVMLCENRLSKPRDALGQTREGANDSFLADDLEAVVQDAEELGLVATWPSEGRAQFGFRHPILQAYLAARAMRDVSRDPPDSPLWPDVVTQSVHEDALRALEMLGGIAPASVVDELVPSLLSSPCGAERSELALRRTVAACNAARLGGRFALFADEIYKAIKDYWNAPTVDRIAAVEALTAVGSEDSLAELWARAIDDDYPVKWATVEAFTDRPAEAFRALESVFGDRLEEAQRWAMVAQAVDLRGNDAASEARRMFEPRFSHVATCLPGIADGLEDVEQQERATAMLADLRMVIADLARHELALGSEASLAQGYKHAARPRLVAAIGGGSAASMVPAARREAEIAELGALVRSARFWYSRLISYQAMARRAVATLALNPSDSLASDAENHIAEALQDEEHPLAREAAEQALKAIRTARGRPTPAERVNAGEALLWHDEHLSVAFSCWGVDPLTTRLLGDVVLILNMNEQDLGDRDRLRLTQREVGTSNLMPACLSTEPDRSRLLTRDDLNPCTPPCSFRLCPYRPESTHRHAYRGELSKAFCRTQRRTAEKLKTPPPWQPNVSPQQLVEFWRELEDRARR